MQIIQHDIPVHKITLQNLIKSLVPTPIRDARRDTGCKNLIVLVIPSGPGEPVIQNILYIFTFTKDGQLQKIMRRYPDDLQQLFEPPVSDSIQPDFILLYANVDEANLI